MSSRDTLDRHSQFIRLVLALLGAFLLVVGWLRWAGFHV